MQKSNKSGHVFTSTTSITTPTSSAIDQYELQRYHPMHDLLKEYTHLGVFSVRMRQTTQLLCANSKVAASEVIS